jgi:4-amino-4-deoxy-L-arabinose transferase-like glycosyltransferase
VSTTTNGRSWRLALAITIAAGVIRLIVAALTPLFPDETYYWEWSRHLAPGYFDHPPAIALLVRAGTIVAGNTALGVRLGSVLASLGGALILLACARRVAGDRAALNTAAVFAIMPLAAAGLVLATPDGPLLAAASATLFALLRVMETTPRSRESLLWWCVTGVLLGLSFDSKYMGVLIPLGVFIAFVTRRALRTRLAEPGPYLATAIAAIVFSPVIIWNARHGWASFAFQLQHGFSGGLSAAVNHELEFIGGQLGLASPILFVLCAIVLMRTLRAQADANVASVERNAMLAIMSITVFAFFMYSATRRRVEPNWPAIGYLPAVILLSASEGGRTWRRWLAAGISVAGVISLVAYVNAFTPILPVRAARDPVARAAGWDSLGSAMAFSIAAARVDIAHGSDHWVAADNYQTASELAFHLPGNPETFSLNLSGRPNQYDFWPSFPDRAKPGDVLWIALDEDPRPATIDSLVPHFASVERMGLVVLARNGGVIKHMRIWRLDAWRGTWPRRQLRSPP